MNNLFKNSFILTLGILLSKSLSLFFIFPFSNLVGTAGVSLFSYAYVPFTLIIDVFGLGLNMGVVKLVSRNNARGMFAQSRKIFHYCLILSIILGISGFFVLYFISPFYARTVLAGEGLTNNVSDVINVIKIISISLPIVLPLQIIRGYIQGNMNMKAIAFSQFVEQFVRVASILLFSYIIVNQYGNTTYAIYFAVFATFLGSIAGIITSYISFIRMKKNEVGHISPVRFKDVLFISLPFAFFSLSFSMYNFVDSLTFNKGLIEYGITNPEHYYGIYSFQVLKLIMIPLALITGLESTLMPLLIKNVESKNQNNVNKGIEASMSFLLYFFIPITILLSIFYKEIYNLFYSSNGEDVLGKSVILIPIMACYTLVIAMIQGTNLQSRLYESITIGILIKVATTYYLTSRLSYNGAVISTAISMTTTTLINLFLLHKYHFIRYRFIALKIIKLGIVGVLGGLSILLIKSIFPYYGGNTVLTIFYLAFNTILFVTIYLYLNKIVWHRMIIDIK